MNTHLSHASMQKRFLSHLLTGIVLFLFSANLFAGSLNLAWDASTSANLGGYRLFYGTNSNNYTSSIDVGKQTSYQVTGLQDGATYYFTAKAYDSQRIVESGYSNEISATIPDPVSVDFTASATNGNASLIVSFTPTTSGTITGYQWDFGDASIPASTSQFPTVTYKNPGTYSVSLTVTSPSGNVTNTKENLITVTTPPPVANFSATPTSGVAPVSVSFKDTSTGNITGRLWAFGDGVTSTDVNPTHIYSTAGTYSVSLTVTGAGGSDTKTNNGFISVSAPPPPPPPATTDNKGLVAAYGFEEATGSTVADASGKGNHGTIRGAVRITKGRYGKALKFDGKSAWVTVKDSASLDLSKSMTLEAWVYPLSQTAGANTVILKEAYKAGVYALYSERSNNLPVSYFNDGRYSSISGSKRLPAYQWTHLVTTYDGQVQRLYVNGRKVAERAKSSLIKSSAGALRIGGNSVWGEYFNGYIDEIRIYNRALTATEVNNNIVTAVSVSNKTKRIMGDRALGPWVDYKPQGIAQAYQTVPKKSGVLTTVKVYLDSSSTATKLTAGIYKDNNGHPGALVAKGKLKSLRPGAWNSVSMSVAPIAKGQPYWIAVLGLDGEIALLSQEGSSTGLTETSASSTLTHLPRRWRGSATKSNASMSIYGKGYPSSK